MVHDPNDKTHNPLITDAAQKFKRAASTNIYREISERHKRYLNVKDDILDKKGSTSFRNKDIDYYKGLFGEIKSKYNEELSDSIYVSTKEENVFSSIMEAVNIVAPKSRLNNDKFYKTIDLITRDKMHKKYTEKSEDNFNVALGINKVVDELSKNRSEYIFKTSDGKKNIDTSKMEKFLDGLNLDEKEKREIIVDVANQYMQLSGDRDLYKKISREQDDVNRSISKEILNVKNLTDKFGTSKGDPSGVTVGDVIKNKEKFTGNVKNIDGEIRIDMIEELEELVKKDPKYANIIVDKNLKKTKDGEIYSVKDLNDSFTGVKDTLKKSPISKFFSATEFMRKDAQKELITLQKGSTDHILSSTEGEGFRKIRNNYHYIQGKFYEEKDGTISHKKELDDYYLISNKSGVRYNLLRKLTMDAGATTDSKGGFDIRKKHGPNKIDNFKSFIGKGNDPDWIGNALKNIKQGSNIRDLQKELHKEQDPTKKLVLQMMFNQEIERGTKNIVNMNRAFKSKTKAPSIAALKELSKIKDPNIERFSNLMNESTEEAFEKLKSIKPKDIKNRDLNNLIKSYMKDPKELLSRVHKDKSGNGLASKVNDKDIDEMLKIELMKEMFMTEIERSKNPSGALELVKKMNLTGKNKEEMERIAAWAMFQYETGATSNKRDFSDERFAVNAIDKGKKLINAEQKDKDSKDHSLFDFQKIVNKMFQEEYGPLSKGRTQFPSEDSGAPYASEYLTIRKFISPIEALNDETKRKAFFKQFVAGKDDPENITTATLGVYYFADKLNKALDPIGLSFSGKDASSTKELLLNLGLKRVLPAVGGIKALSYFDYRMQAYTGHSLRGAAANTAATADLAFRSITDITGLTNTFKRAKEYNPILQYITDSKTFMSREEKLKYYERGKSPVRSSRFFSFGSLSEFRGGKVNYFQPNWFQRAHSDAKDISIYGSVKDKWKYSWIPTPRHPFSTISRILDPYRLEREHYWDRPYPVTGDMFGHTFPGSGLLNATVGRFLKPRIKMHRGHSLGRGGNKFVDARAMIEEENNRIRAKVNSGLIQLDKDGNLVPITYHSNRTPGTQEVNIHIERGQIQINREGNDELLGLDPSEFAERMDEIIETKESIVDGGEVKRSGKFTKLDVLKKETERIMQTPFTDMMRMGKISDNIATNEINKANKAILDKASKPSKGVITRDQIFNVSADQATHLLHDSEVLADLRSTTSTQEYLSDIGYQAQKLTGMYGFAFGKTFKGKKSYALDDASRMTSSSRAFWDMNLGGLGGRPMHFVRRLIPHENRNVEKVNYIRNTMPEWMPDRFKFGDPYAMIPKGEMRLPGSGYESMFQLHPDRYGRDYGAFDRMKILADIAPWSQEYKLWRSIAEKEVKDPELMEEMKEIKRRVIEQSKQHDFYNYKFKGVKVDTKDAIITEVFGGNKFKVKGDSKTYRIAKVDQLIEGSEEVIRAGMSIRLTTGRDETPDSPEISAIIHHEGTNINKKLLDNKLATESISDTVMDAQATLSGSQIFKGKIYETIAHADIPIIHKKFLRVESPLESYKNERVYGTSHSTWSNPIKGWIRPAFTNAASVGMVRQAISTGLLYASQFANDGFSNMSKNTRMAINAGLLLTNKGAMAGAGVGLLLGGRDLAEKGAQIGAMAQTLMYTAANSKQLTKSTVNMSMLGGILSHQLFNKYDSMAGAKGAAVGAALAITTSGMQTSFLNKSPKKYIPKNTRKKWEIEEYFDRLKYVKYSGLYEKAARMAKRKEGVDIAKVLRKLELDKEENKKIKEELMNSRETISNTYSEGDPTRERLLAEINHKLGLLESPETILKGGQYTKSAVAYKQAMDSTIYGLKEDANWAQILRALPKNERDYMLEFAKEQDPKKRKEIYEIVSPYQRKILDIAWGNKPAKQRSNKSYFSSHLLPNGFWSGWKSTTDLDKVKLRVIENEGMLLSDFGYYESELQDPAYLNSPKIGNYKKNVNGPLSTINLIRNMQGRGLSVGNVSIEPTRDPGVKANMNVRRSRSKEVKREIARGFNLPLYI